MLKIEFKRKLYKLWLDDENYTMAFDIPKQFKLNYCEDFNSWRNSKAYGSLFNSNLMPQILNRIKTKVFGEYSEFYRLDKNNPNIKIDTSGFLASVTILVDADIR